MSIRVRTDLFIDSGGTTEGIEIPENTISDKDVPLKELIFPVNFPWLNENLVMKDVLYHLFNLIFAHTFLFVFVFYF